MKALIAAAAFVTVVGFGSLSPAEAAGVASPAVTETRAVAGHNVAEKTHWRHRRHHYRYRYRPGFYFGFGPAYWGSSYYYRPRHYGYGYYRPYWRHHHHHHRRLYRW